MGERDDLLRAVRAARSGDQLITAVAALDEHDQARTAAIARSRETDLSATAVRQTLDPVPLYERHTAATDWLGDYEAPAEYRTAMIAEASKWYRSIPPGLAGDPEEFREQALGRAYTAASAYGDSALAARREFMTYLSFLTAQGASGLPQIDQTVDPHDAPAPTPYPTEVFDNFAPEQNDLNAGVESPAHQSQISSEQAPGIQELEQQNSGGSGFGSGPAKPAEHSTAMDVADSYAEVPLGAPGRIPTEAIPSGAMPSAPSTPNPALGENQDKGAERRPNAITSALTAPDHEGFRWQAGADAGSTVATPYHEKCGSLHWPEEACHHGQEHTASVAVGYLMNAEDFARRARFESLGAQEGDAIARLGSFGKLAAHHNAIAAGFRAEARTEDEIAWLHGYLSRVRPVLAKGAVPSDDDPSLSGTCPGCGGKPGKNGGLCKACIKAGRGRKKGKTGSRLDFPEAPSGLTVASGVISAEAIRKGAPFAGYKDFAACVAANSDKDDPQAYCGKIKHQVEGAIHPEDRAWSNEPGGYYGNHGGNEGGYSGSEGHYSEGYEGADQEVPHHMLGDFRDLWHSDPDSWEHREPTNADREAFRQHVQRNYSPEVYKAYFRHQGASSLPQVQETIDSHDNPNPGGDQLNPAVMFPLNPAFGGDGDKDDQAKEAARRSMTPSTSAVRMFGRLDAMEGKRPHHKDGYPFSDKAHGQYLRGWNDTRAVIDAVNDNDPVSRADYAEWTGRPDLHKHYMGTYAEMKARHGSPEPPQATAMRRQADTLTRPHVTTDDGSPPFNSAQTSPDPWSSNEGSGDYSAGVRDGQEDAAAGEHPTFADNSAQTSPYVKGYSVGYSGRPPDTGVPDVPRSMGGDSGQAMNAGEAQRAFQVSKASLQRHAERFGIPRGYTSVQHADGRVHAIDLDDLHDDRSLWRETPVCGAATGVSSDEGGRDAVQPRALTCPDCKGILGVHTGSRRTARDFSQDEREEAKSKGDTLPGTTKLPIENAQDLENAERLKGKVKGASESTIDAYLDRKRKEFGKAAFTVSRAFLTAEALRTPGFEQGYRFGARWRPGMRLAKQGSPAFEAGLYAALSDRRGVQEAWANEHYRLSRKFPVLGARLDAHSSFTVKFAKAHGNRYLISSSGYLVPAAARRDPARQARARQITAGTTVDLITDGPGTSPDPMGSTPLNGPGTPPPMGGGEDPARSGGPPPYQGSEPQGAGPVAPDDVLGMPQEAPQKSGPFTQTFSGRQPGNIDLAPAAPNAADGKGYQNQDAYQGDPQRYQQAMAFRRRVQASLAAARG